MIKELTMEKTSLPVGWEMKIFDEVINFSQIGLVRNNKEQSLEYDFRYLKMNNINNDNGLNEDSFKFVNATNEEVEKYQLVNDDFLFNTRNSFELVGKNCLYQSDYKKPTLFNNNILRVRFKEFLVPEFVAYAFSSKQLVDDLEKLKSGTTNVVGIYYKSLKNLEIPVPPLPQQKQIVALLDKAFAAIDTAKANAEQNLQNAKELFESYLKNVFENKGDDWEEKTIGDLGKPSMCKRILKEQTSSSGDIPFYKIGTFGKTPNAFISKELYEEYKTKYSFPNKGDILISASGTIGRRVIYNGEPAFFQDSNIVWIDNDEKQVLNEYLYCFYGFCDWQPSKGATISRLYNANLKRIKISFPKSLLEQKTVIQKIEVLSNKTKKLEAIYAQKLADLEELKKSVLQKAFSGQLNTIN
tara:strand:- start:6 stop:1244 length:1239 start_codon:yes stop_codon:yes gene_type:complete